MNDNMDEALKYCFSAYEEVTARLIKEGVAPFEVASIMIVTALRIYKTLLSEEEFNEVISHIGSTKDKVRSFAELTPTSSLH